MFEAGNVATQFAINLRTIIEAVAEHDPDLARQLRRAAGSVALNTAEAGRRSGRDSKSRYRIAASECAEAATVLVQRERDGTS